MRGFKGQMQGGMQQKGQGMMGGRGPQQQGSEEGRKQLEGQGPRQEHGPEKPPMDDWEQDIVVNEDGIVTVTLTGTDPEGNVRSNTTTISDSETGGVEIAKSNVQGKSKTVTITEDEEDGGVDLDIVCVNEEGETVTKHIELDMNEDGTISFEALINKDGEEHLIERDIELARFLGEEGEELTVAEVVEAHLERGPVDIAEIDLSGLNNLTAEVDLLLV